MTRDQIESILKTAGAKSDKEGGHAFSEGSNLTFHVSHDGASLSFAKIETVRFDGALVYAKSARQSIALAITDVFAVAVEGGSNAPSRRPAGFG